MASCLTGTGSNMSILFVRLSRVLWCLVLRGAERLPSGEKGPDPGCPGAPRAQRCQGSKAARRWRRPEGDGVGDGDEDGRA